MRDERSKPSSSDKIHDDLTHTQKDITPDALGNFNPDELVARKPHSNRPIESFNITFEDVSKVDRSLHQYEINNAIKKSERTPQERAASDRVVNRIVQDGKQGIPVLTAQKTQAATEIASPQKASQERPVQPPAPDKQQTRLQKLRAQLATLQRNIQERARSTIDRLSRQRDNQKSTPPPRGKDNGR